MSRIPIHRILPELMRLTENDLHIWQARFSDLLPQHDAFRHILTPDEVTRAARFRFDDARERFVLARGFLRRTLAPYLAITPDAVDFAYGARGKPILPSSDIRFNLTHSADRLLLGVCRDRMLGVDVEHMGPMDEMLTVARMNFSPNEQRIFFALPTDEQQRAFYTCWTRKEAYIKATGDGFKMPLSDFDVTFTPDQSPRLLRIVGDDPARWRMLHLDPAPDYVGAICVRDGDSLVLTIFGEG